MQPPKSLFEAAERNAAGYIVRIVERSLEFNINQKDKYQRNAAHWAAEAGSVEALECLLDYGVDADATECNGRTPLHLAARSGHLNTVKVLMESKNPQDREKDANRTDFFGITPVYLAMQRGELGAEAFEFLMSECGGHYNQTAFKYKDDPAEAAGPLTPAIKP